jgi:hypothetical protein
MTLPATRKLPATFGREHATRSAVQLSDFRESAMLQFARDSLAAARGCFEVGDPLNVDSMHAMVRHMCKHLADLHERNAVRMVDLALAGAEDADQGLRDLIAERNGLGVPLGAALATYSTIISERASAHRRPHSRPCENFLANFVIVCLIIALRQQFPDLRLRRSVHSAARAKRRRPSAFSIMATVLAEAKLGRGGEEAIRKIWERYGPPVNPGFGGWNLKK